MGTKATYDKSVRAALRAQLDAISLRVGMATIPQMPPYPKQLSRPWEPEEPSYEEDDKEDDDKDEESRMRYQLSSPRLTTLHFFGIWDNVIFKFSGKGRVNHVGYGSYYQLLSIILISDSSWLLLFLIFRQWQFLLCWFYLVFSYLFIFWTPKMMMSVLFLLLCLLLCCWAPGMMMSLLFSLVFILFCGHLEWWCRCVVFCWVLFQIFFHFKFSCKIMSDKCESKSGLRMRNDKNCVKTLDSALIITLFVCLA